MASYIVMKPADGPARGEFRFVRDGFSVLALIFPVFWLLWHRLWIEAALLFAAILALAAAIEWAGWTLTGSLFSFLLALYVALEGPTLRQWALRRRGWYDAGIVDAPDEDEAMMRYFGAGSPVASTEEPPVPRPTDIAVPTHAPVSGPALGLLSYPARR